MQNKDFIILRHRHVCPCCFLSYSWKNIAETDVLTQNPSIPVEKKHSSIKPIWVKKKPWSVLFKTCPHPLLLGSHTFSFRYRILIKMHKRSGKSIFVAGSENAFDQFLKNTSVLQHGGAKFLPNLSWLRWISTDVYPCMHDGLKRFRARGGFACPAAWPSAQNRSGIPPPGDFSKLRGTRRAGMCPSLV